MWFGRLDVFFVSMMLMRMMVILFFPLFILFDFLRGHTEGFERESKRARCTRARTRANYWSSFPVQLWKLWKDIYWCWCFEEAFSHPWGETICLSLWRMWKGMSMFHAVHPSPSFFFQHLFYSDIHIAKLWVWDLGSDLLFKVSKQTTHCWLKIPYTGNSFVRL